MSVLAENEAIQPYRVFARQKVLLVEDNKIEQLLARKVLRRLNLTCEVVANGKLAVEILKTDYDVYSVILMDCEMSVMDGFKATKLIRKMESDIYQQHKPIITLTSAVLKCNRQKCLDVGIDDYFSKPINAFKLSSKMENYL